MQSDGGLTPKDGFNGSRAILSGPAGGVVGYAKTSFSGTPVIGFDMGGTSTDVSRFDGDYPHVFESTTAGITIQAPQLDVNTVAAGGGSRLFFRSGMFVVGPESAGAHPGPVCYRKNGYLTVTDANLILGRILPEFFPHTFGITQDQPLDKEASVRAFENLSAEINKFQNSIGKKPISMEEIATGFIKVANEAMCRPIRALTQAKGYDTRNHVLSCFGGAGGQHACAISRQLGIRTVYIHKYAGILSAYGMACADVVQECQEPCAKSYSKENFQFLDERLRLLETKCSQLLKEQGFEDSKIEIEPFLHLRYDGTDCALMCKPSKKAGDSPGYGNFEITFLERYKKEFGFILPERKIMVDDIRIRGIGKSPISPPDVNETETYTAKLSPKKVVDVYFENIGHLPSQVYILQELPSEYVVDGPAIIIDQLSTILIEPNCVARITKSKDIEITINESSGFNVSEELDAIQLSIFSHRFMSIAEQMGRVLQQTSISTNIKERLDFSCALFGPDGGLVSNAPHIPVHLGAMQETVQYQLRNVGNQLKEGDVLLSNHPKAGGSHLPDLTVITPVFYKNDKPIFFVASRGHHADIGGITPGSMPPHSKSLSEEGATFKSFFLVKEGIFQEKRLIEVLTTPTDAPGSTGTRNLNDNISDLKAQIASNQKGIYLVTELIDYYGLKIVQAYMNHIQKNAELAVRDLLQCVGEKLVKETGGSTITACDYLDDGSKINLKLSIDQLRGCAVFDFTGTGYEVWGNCNAPRAITLSAIIYCLRCMVGHDVPLNQGCLNPINVIIPEGSLLDPSDDAAVVGGNVQTSQRIVDVIFKAFKATAASQGCMNNITFGQEDWGYYETVAGGAGAGPTWHGKSGVHVHMTNTRITDAEILERRYPIFLKKFSLRPDSGGKGKFNGGDGVVRELLFRAPMVLSILTERRVFAPYGLEGGEPGARGENLLIKKNGRIIRLPSKIAASVEAEEVFQLNTPGGGGYGSVVEKNESDSSSLDKESSVMFIQRGSVYNYNLEQESI
ncbi:5-oxoprolinase isoform X2 [Planococcus citri]